MKLGLMVGVAALLSVIGCGGEANGVYEQIRQREAMELVALYCQYGSVSTAQAKGCATHVDPNYVDRSGSNAARWARGELLTCKFDAGPLCGLRERVRLEKAVGFFYGRP